MGRRILHNTPESTLSLKADKEGRIVDPILTGRFENDNLRGVEDSRYKVMKVKRLQPLFWAIFSLAIGMSAGGLQSDALREWYPTLNKPELTPPDWVFPIAWTLLYILMGLSIGLVRISGRPGYKAVTGIFLVQLALNFFWSVAFFYLRRPTAGLGIITLLIPLLLLYVKQSLPLSKIGAYLFIPYILWVGFAWYLNFFIVLHN